MNDLGEIVNSAVRVRERLHQGVHMVRQNNGGMDFPFAVIVMQRGCHCQVTVFGTQHSIFPVAPSNEIDPARLLEMRQVSSGYLKRLHR